MADDRTSPYEQAERNLTAWHATHPDATFYDMEVAVEAQIERLRTALLGSQTEGTFTEVMRQCAERRRQHMARRLAQQTASHPSSSDPPDINQRPRPSLTVIRPSTTPGTTRTPSPKPGPILQHVKPHPVGRVRLEVDARLAAAGSPGTTAGGAGR